MESSGLFIVGLFMTIAVCGALAVIVWAAVQDGEREAASRVERAPHGPAPLEGDGGAPLAVLTPEAGLGAANR